MVSSLYKLTKPLSKIRHKLSYVKEMSDQEVEFYAYNFPVVSYERKTMIECRLLFNSQNKDVLCQIWDVSNNCIYSGFTSSYGNYKELEDKITNKMNYEFKKLGVEEYGESRKRSKKSVSM